MRVLAFFAIWLMTVSSGCSQDERHRIMFYNVENLFDTQNDSLTADDDFTPPGDLHWTAKRLNDKLNKISKVIIAAGEWQPPAIIGLCEIENRRVLDQLIYQTPLAEFGYSAVHFESPDERGIDVALLYQPDAVRIYSASAIRVKGDNMRTRDILFCTTLMEGDTVHFFINHWPSRSAGQLETEGLRMAAAHTLRHLVDSLFLKNQSARIVIMGDLNDEPTDESIVKGLSAMPFQNTVQPGVLYNLSSPTKGQVKGTLKYQGFWNVFDQIIVSGGLLNGDGIYVEKDGYRVFYLQSMLEPDVTFHGVKPFRTYLGYRYHGGFSDHLPVYLDIMINE